MKKKPWNGTRTEKKRNTIEEKFKEYCFLLCWFSVLICILLFLVVGVYTKTYNVMIDSTYWLEELYSEIDSMQNSTTEYAFFEDEDWQEKYANSLETVKANLLKLHELNVSGNYKRNLSDLENLLDNYDTGRKTVMELANHQQNRKENAQASAEYLESYNSLRAIYTAMVNKKSILYNELHAYFNQQRTVLRGKLAWMFCIIVAALLAGFFIVWRNTRQLSKSITVPLKWLTEKARKIRENNLDEFLPIEKESISYHPEDVVSPVEEIFVLDSGFHAMLVRIQEQIMELKESMAIREQLKEQEMENLRISNLLTTSELHCLQMQMNPHFLFNTLNMIQQTIYLDKKEKTSFLLKETASFLRYNLDYVGKNVALRVEMEALGNYISLQEERLGDRIFFEFELDETINPMKVPSLILQPLVENSLIHGVADITENAVIRIITEYLEQEQYGCIRIADNGHGISPEKLETIRENMASKDIAAEKSIGLSNVYKRLSIFTEKTAVMTIDSELEKGTIVTIKIPYVRDMK